MFHSENNTEIMKSHIVSLYKRLLIFIVKLQAIIKILYCGNYKRLLYKRLLIFIVKLQAIIIVLWNYSDYYSDIIIVKLQAIIMYWNKRLL